jgi:hypothetical protein
MIGRRMLRRIATWTAVVLAVFIPGRVRAQYDAYTAPRNAVVNTAGARLIKVSAGAGFLHINGRSGTTQVQVTGVARASSRQILDQIRLVAERQGDVVMIKMVVPEETSSFWNLFRGNFYQALDLTIEVPAGLPLDVSDGSGETTIKGTGPVTIVDGSGDLELSGIGGKVNITDGSGNIIIRGVDGDVYVDDGSGNIDANNVTGNFTIGDDGSGTVDIMGVGGTMRINQKGSGPVNVSRVGGDFVVDSKGSGSISYDTVKGAVTIPERKRRSRG